MNKSILALHAEYFGALDKELIRLHNQALKSGKKVSEYFPGLLPMFYRDKNSATSDVLISGINPSFTNSFNMSFDNTIFSYEAFLKQSLVEQEITIEKLIGIQESLIQGKKFNEDEFKQIDYFKKIQFFLNSIQYTGTWDHCDVFPIRCTSQKVFLEALGQMKEYKMSLIDLYINYLKSKKYKLVMVFNRSASDFIRINLNLKPTKNNIFSRNKTFGFYKTEQVPGTQFFLFKMLSGQNPPNKEEKEKLIEVVSTYLQYEFMVSQFDKKK
jgi:hypothetical protein